MTFDTLTSTLTSSLPLPLPFSSTSWRGGAKEKEKKREQEKRQEEGIEELFMRCEQDMPERWRDGWYVVVATALLATSQPHHLRDLYIHLARPLSSSPASPPPPPPSSSTTDPPPPSSSTTDPPSPANQNTTERDRLTLRLRDTCQKAWILTGIAPVLAGIGALAEGERELGLCYDEIGGEEGDEGKGVGDDGEGDEGKGVGGLSERWKSAQLTPSTLRRGQSFVTSLYAHNLAPTFANAWGSHLHDIRWQQESVIYGLFLSEHSILSAIETEMVTLSALLCGRVEPPKRWHLRGLRRLGVSRTEVEGVVGIVERVALWGGVSEGVVAGWPRVGDVEGEV